MIKTICRFFRYLRNRHAVLEIVLERLRNDLDCWYPVMYLGEFFIYTGDSDALENRRPILEIGTFFCYIYLPRARYRFFLPLAGKEIVDHLIPGSDFNQRIAEFIRFSPFSNLSLND
ncbi:MAG: hypothetical protein PHE24_01930 [Patescibacteria group bacterium]|nr:hypothetical protein [Patescibacteria group bacterium]